ncbi:hypothetical protein [Streptomyces sp. NBC_00829]|uniref:hypothetical protein n=1 Tax=Streptomyces sp. NBC_00829 TaxID=2903679 RepID=UPI00386C8D61|nr:hypothetical protein OG293_18165 [Streptomyces sp. NBC_00829]
MAIATRGGASVTIRPHKWHGIRGYAWYCTGCDQRGSSTGGAWCTTRMPVPQSHATASARSHARTCYETN